MRKAFTLAEVLITLAIIGVVAAMTIPTLISNYNKRVVEVRLQKTYAVLAQSIRLAEAEYGSLQTWVFKGDQENLDHIDNFIKNHILKNVSYSKYCYYDNILECFDYPVKSASGKFGFSSNPYQIRAVVLNNGATVYFQIGSFADALDKHIHIAIDVNGNKNGENLLGKDIFSTFLSFGANSENLASGYFMYGYQIVPTPTRDEMLVQCGNANPRMCSAIIQGDGWQIKEDYPW